MWFFKWLFTKKAVGNPPMDTPKIQKERFDITIVLASGKEIGYNQIHPMGSGKTCIRCFLNFYRWFYEKKSPYYTFMYRSGGDILIRSEIRGVWMKKSIIEENV